MAPAGVPWPPYFRDKLMRAAKCRHSGICVAYINLGCRMIAVRRH